MDRITSSPTTDITCRLNVDVDKSSGRKNRLVREKKIFKRLFNDT